MGNSRTHSADRAKLKSLHVVECFLWLEHELMECNHALLLELSAEVDG